VTLVGGSGAEAIPAATVIPLRDGPDGIEVLMLRKNSKLAFGGMWVFPGGRVDAGDGRDGEDLFDVAPARRAAAREAVEEAALVVDPAEMVLFSHWTPPEGAPRRFDTWFFVAPAILGAEVVIDMGEIHDHGWLRPADALVRRDAGEYELAPPTWMSLWRLSTAPTMAAALEEARTAPIIRYETHMVVDGPLMTCIWVGDAAYETGDLGTPGGRHRLLMDPAGWQAVVSL
jgi:8-oxo-dGTP pyrophosphatase MutT (NUDIX family)